MGTQPRIIGVSGFMRTGKDSVAALLEEYGYTRLAFADPLRKVAADIDPTISLVDVPEGLGLAPFDVVTYTQLIDKVGYERAKEVPDFRRFLQRLGTEGIRGNFGEGAWVDLAIKAIEAAPDGTKFVIPDVRFPNEADAIHKLGGVVWMTVRPGYGASDHPSEAEVGNIIPDVVLEAPDLYVLGVLVHRTLEIPLDKELIQRWARRIYANA